MLIQITFKNGSNPYIVKTNKELWRMINKYYLVQDTARTFIAEGTATIWTAKPGKLTARERAKTMLRDFAQEWQYRFYDFSYSWMELANWQDFFTEYGKKYGLLREFKENGIC